MKVLSQALQQLRDRAPQKKMLWMMNMQRKLLVRVCRAKTKEIPTPATRGGTLILSQTHT